MWGSWKLGGDWRAYLGYAWLLLLRAATLACPARESCSSRHTCPSEGGGAAPQRVIDVPEGLLSVGLHCRPMGWEDPARQPRCDHFLRSY